ncbi:glutathione-s-transferase theta, gst [Salix suchowensis]|nr:glutathione-s-transferase theta, gst [Salix suchowensis]
MVVKVYGPHYASTKRVLVCLAEKGIEFETYQIESDHKVLCRKTQVSGDRFAGREHRRKGARGAMAGGGGSELPPADLQPDTPHLVASALGFAPDEKLIKESEEKLAKVLDIYEERLSRSRYLAGDFFSLADLSHLPFTQYLVGPMKKEFMIRSRKHVSAWWDDISSRPSWKKVSLL